MTTFRTISRNLVSRLFFFRFGRILTSGIHLRGLIRDALCKAVGKKYFDQMRSDKSYCYRLFFQGYERKHSGPGICI